MSKYAKIMLKDDNESQSTVILSEDEHEEIMEEFNLRWAESGSDREYISDSDKEQRQYEYISKHLGTEDWGVE